METQSHSSFRIHHSSFVFKDSQGKKAKMIHHSSLITHHSSFRIHHSSLIIPFQQNKVLQVAE